MIKRLLLVRENQNLISFHHPKGIPWNVLLAIRILCHKKTENPESRGNSGWLNKSSHHPTIKPAETGNRSAREAAPGWRRRFKGSFLRMGGWRIPRAKGREEHS